ncbi:Short-chain dehydrogenase TIC 32 chloroplastic [Bienertia sinuspersici]
MTSMISGATSGIGVETTQTLAMCGVHVMMAVRNVDAGKKLDVMELDLSSLASVEKFASELTEYKSLKLPLNLVVLGLHTVDLLMMFYTSIVSSNNAGIIAIPFQQSKDNIALQFATSHLGHFHLMNLLLDAMKKTVHESHREGRLSVFLWRPIGCDSLVYMLTSDLIHSCQYCSYNRLQAYGQSKLANILHACKAIKERVRITANSLHPGSITTNLLRHHNFINGIIHTLGKLVLKDVSQGVATSCYVALHPQVEGLSNEYFMDSNIAEPTSQAKDAELAKKLWDFSLKFGQV